MASQSEQPQIAAFDKAIGVPSRYLAFDVHIDRYLEGKITFEEAMENYHRMLGSLVLDQPAPAT